MSSSNRYRSLNLDLLRAYKTTATRYGRDAPFELVSVDVRRIGRIPQRGVSRSWGRSNVKRTTRVGYDYIHSAVDDHSRLAYSEIHPDEKGIGRV